MTFIRFDADFTMTIDGSSTGAQEHFSVLDPSTEECIAQAPEATSAQLDDAVSAARRAFPAWRDTPLEQRQRILRALADRLEQHAGQFARLLTSEQGKPLADAGAELGRCVHWLRAFAGMSLPVEDSRMVQGIASRRPMYHLAWWPPSHPGTFP